MDADQVKYLGALLGREVNFRESSGPDRSVSAQDGSAFPSEVDSAATSGEFSKKTATKPLMWEELVTDGHVLAARLRRVAPWLIGTAISLLVLSVIRPATGLSSPWAWATATSSQLIELRRAEYTQPLTERLEATPTQQFTYQQLHDLAPVEEIPSAVQIILASLNRGGGLFTPKLYLKEIPSSAFWNWEWTPQEQSSEAPAESPKPNSEGKIPDNIYVAKGIGDVYSLGAFARQTIATGNGSSTPRAVRWVAIARKYESGWKLVSLEWGDFYLATQSATVSDIPTSLRLAVRLPEPK